MAQAPATAPAATEDPAVTASRQAFEALPEADRKAIQEALIWVVPYNATAGGTFGRQTYNGIVAFQKMKSVTPDGILVPQTASALQAAATVARNAVGFKAVRDDKTGVELGLPVKVLSKQSVTPTGRRWQSVDDKITLDTKMVAGATPEMQALYEKTIAAAPGRKVTYKFLRPDFFVVTGETANGEFYVRYALGQEGLRGFTFAYDKSVKPDASRLMIAIANSFVPFPGTVPLPAPAAQAAPKPVALAASRARLTGDAAKVSTGIRVGSRQIVTVGAACDAPVVAGTPARVIKRAGDMALMEAASDTAVTALPVRSGPVTPGNGLVVVAWDASAGALGVNSGTGEGEQGVSAAMQIGGRGGLVFDRAGAVVGIIGSATTPLRILSGVAMPARYDIVTVKAIQDFVGSSGAFSGEATATSQQTAGAIAVSASSRMTDVVCP